MFNQDKLAEGQKERGGDSRRVQKMTSNRVNCLTKNSYFHEKCDGLLFEQGVSFVKVCSNGFSDTFNTVTVTDIDGFCNKSVIEEIKEYYRMRNIPMSVWIFCEKNSSKLELLLKECGLIHAETMLAMSLELECKDIEIFPSNSIKEIKPVENTGQLEDYCAVLGSLWDPPCPYLLKHMLEIHPLLLSKESPLKLFVAYDTTERPVATGSVLFTPNEMSTAGLYDIATLAEERGKGIGSHMLLHLLSFAKSHHVKLVVLQGSHDGQNIYKRMGFTNDGNVIEYSNGISLTEVVVSREESKEKL
eukprot:Nk52_evm10s1444 gene=Nk52_evmTU10s1444